MKPTRLLNLTLTIALLGSAGSLVAQQYYGPAPYADRDAEQRDLERRGFQDGMFRRTATSRTIGGRMWTTAMNTAMEASYRGGNRVNTAKGFSAGTTTG